MRAAGEHPRFDFAVVEPRHDRDIEGQATSDSFDDPHELAPRAPASARAHGEEVDDARTVPTRLVCSYKHQAVLHVLATNAGPLPGADAEVTALLPVEQA